MKKFLLALAVLAFAMPAFADQWVNGYYRKDVTYVAGHWRSSPNSTTDDNYSSYPNVNPYTGQQGTRKPDNSWLKPTKVSGPGSGLNDSGDNGSSQYKPYNPYAPKKNCPPQTSIYQPRCD